MSVSSPLVTFIVMCYNQEEFIREAVSAAFAQQYSPMEILISDDCSRDSTFEIVTQMVNAYSGPHRVTCVRNPANIGIAEHLNKVNRHASGELVVIAAGDDISLPNRTARIVAEYLANGGNVNYFYSSAREMAMDGSKRGRVISPGAAAADSKLRSGLSPYPLAIGATQAWTKVLTDSFGPLHQAVWAEDQILGFRGMLLGTVCFIDEPLVDYRVGSGISTRKTGFAIKKYFKGKWSGIEIFRQRCRDAWHVRQYAIATIIAGKIMLLAFAMPFSPFYSVLKKIIRR